MTDDEFQEKFLKRSLGLIAVMKLVGIHSNILMLIAFVRILKITNPLCMSMVLLCSCGKLMIA